MPYLVLPPGVVRLLKIESSPFSCQAGMKVAPPLFYPITVSSSLALELVLLYGKSHLQKLLFLFLVDLLQACRHGSARVAASVHDVLAVVVLGLVEQRFYAWLREAPRSGVERLLLRPDNSLCVGVLV